jgi:hypothetical protein
MAKRSHRLEAGDLFRFGMSQGLYNLNLNHRMGVYIGEDHIHRDDGVTVENHKVLMMGETVPRTIDRSLLTFIMEVVPCPSE